MAISVLKTIVSVIAILCVIFNVLLGLHIIPDESHDFIILLSDLIWRPVPSQFRDIREMSEVFSGIVLIYSTASNINTRLEVIEDKSRFWFRAIVIMAVVYILLFVLRWMPESWFPSDAAKFKFYAMEIFAFVLECALARFAGVHLMSLVRN